MGHRYPSVWAYRLFVGLLAMSFLTTVAPSPSLADNHDTTPALNFLVVNSFQRDIPWQKSFESGLKTGLEEKLKKYQVYMEYLDAGRIPEIGHLNAFRSYLETKYRSTKIDVVVTDSRPAHRFLSNFPNLFPGARRLSVQPGEKLEFPNTIPAKVGDTITLANDFATSISEMLRLVAPNKVYVVADASQPSRKKRLESFKTILATTWPNLETEFLVDLPMEELLDRVSRLPERSAIFYLLIFSDGKGQIFVPYQAAKLMTQRANAPMFSNWESLMGSGIVGGYLLSGERAGYLTARYAAALGLGHAFDPAQENGYGYYYDWRQLKRWNIDERQLPPDTIIRFRNLTAFEEYKWQILVTLFTLFLLAALSLTLFVVNRKRKRALEALQVERHILEVRVAERTRELKYEIDIKNRFFSIISHDLKSPFTSLLGMTEMMSQMANRFSKDKLVECATSVNKAGNQVFGLLNNLLDWSRLQIDGAKLEPKVIPLQELTQESIDILMPIAVEKEITLTNRMNKTSVFADWDMVQTVIRNLITNSLKFTPSGGSIEVSSHKPGDMVQVTVADTGVGMSKKQAEKIFDLDQKTSTTGTAGEKGTGLGLPLCKDMLKRNGGRIWVESTPDEGSRFHFTLPVEPCEE